MAFHARILIAFLLSIHFSKIGAVQISVGTTSLDSPQDQCSNIQEFSCINDFCDPFAGNKCRNGGNPSQYCSPGLICALPQQYHCLENTITAEGKHSTPNATRGTPKHFSCLSVQSFDKPVVVWENDDCTGQSCFIPNNGNYETWEQGAQGNCVDIGVASSVETVPCLAAGQGTANYPSTGGFLRGEQVWVGGEYGMPVSFDESSACMAYNTAPEPESIPVNDTSPPLGDLSQQYLSGITDYGDPDIVDKREADLHKRANQFTTALRQAYDYRGNWNRDGPSVGNRLWYFIDSAGHLLAWSGQGPRNGMNADHIVELNMIMSFFGVQRNSPWDGQMLGIPNNVWAFCWDFLRSMGQRSVGGAQCADYTRFAQYVGGDGNMCGIDQRVNALKGLVIDALLRTATPVVSSYTRIEAQGALEYCMFGALQAAEAGYDIGFFLGGLIGGGTADQLGQAFKTYVENTFNAAVHWLGNAVNQPRGYFALE